MSFFLCRGFSPAVFTPVFFCVMRYINVSTLLLVLFLCAGMLRAEESAPQKLKLTLAEAKQIALEQNPSLAQVEAGIQTAMAALESAHSSYLPSVDLSAGVTRLRDVATRPVRDYDNTTQYDLGLSASYLVFDGFARRFRTLSAELGTETATAECEDAKRLLMDSVAYAFYQVLLAQNTMEIREQDAAFNRLLHEDAKKKYDYGTSKLSEVLNFEYQVKTAEADYVTARNSWRTACVSLGALLSLQQDNLWESIELVAPAEDAGQNGELPAVSEMISYAMEHRPDLQNARRNVETAELSLKEAKAGWAPTVSLFGNYDFTRTHSAHFNSHYDRDINFGVKASWNLFNGGATTAAIHQAEAQLNAAQKALIATEDTVSSEVRKCHLSLRSAAEILEKENILLDVATRIRDLVREEYLGGTATITRLNEVQTNLTSTSLARTNAWIDLLYAGENLSSVTGGYPLAK